MPRPRSEMSRDMITQVSYQGRMQHVMLPHFMWFNILSTTQKYVIFSHEQINI